MKGKRTAIIASIGMAMLGDADGDASFASTLKRELRVRASDAVEIYYREFGEGDALVLIPGGPGISGSYFVPLATELAGSHRVIVADPRGTGRSVLDPFDETKLNMDAMVGDLESIRDQLGVARWTLVGHSFGGLVAMSYGAKHGERVRAMVLIGSAGITPDFNLWYQPNVIARLDPSLRAELASWQNPDRFMEDPERAVVETMRITSPAMIIDRQLLDSVAAETLRPEALNPKVTLAMQPYLATYDLRHEMSRLQVPVLIIQGRQDPVGETTAYQIRDAIAGSELRFIESSAHWPFVEQKDAFRSALVDFLKGRAGSDD